MGSGSKNQRDILFTQPQLKNKPHPRWAKSGSSPGQEFDKCHAHARSRSASEDSVVDSERQSDPSQSSSKNLNADLDEGSLDKQMSSLLNDTVQPDYLSSSFSGNSAPLSTLSYSPYFDIHSPPSAPSTGIVTPTEEYPQLRVAVAGDQPLDNDIDLMSLFMPCPEILACDEGRGHVDRVLQANTHSQHAEPCSIKYNHGQFLDGHCGCLNEAASYNVLLELSLRLRKAADILSHSANHRFNHVCPLNHKIVDLDAFAT